MSEIWIETIEGGIYEFGDLFNRPEKSLPECSRLACVLMMSKNTPTFPHRTIDGECYFSKDPVLLFDGYENISLAQKLHAELLETIRAWKLGQIIVTSKGIRISADQKTLYIIISDLVKEIEAEQTDES